MTALFMAACSRWMAVQPYVPLENITESWRQFSATIIARRALEETVRNLVGATVFCLPFSIPLAWNEARRIPIKIHLVVIAIEAGMVYRLAQPLPWLGNTVTLFGVLLPGTVSIGDRPQSAHSFSSRLDCTTRSVECQLRSLDAGRMAAKPDMEATHRLRSGNTSGPFRCFDRAISAALSLYSCGSSNGFRHL